MMETMLLRERYKVVRILWSQPDYALAEAVDIQDRETPTLLLNLYEGDLLYRYGRICSAISQRDCPQFRGMFLEGETLAAVFEDCRGVSIDRIFHRGDQWSWRDRLEFAQLVLHQALSMANLPPEVSCAAMLSDNLMVDVPERRVRVRYLLRPTEELEPRELALLAGDQVRKILLPGLRAPDAQLEFLDRLDREGFGTIVPLYAAWREALPGIQAEYEEYEAKNFVAKGLVLLKRWVKRRKRRGRI